MRYRWDEQRVEYSSYRKKRSTIILKKCQCSILWIMKRDHVLTTSLNSELDSYDKSFVSRLVRKNRIFFTHSIKSMLATLNWMRSYSYRREMNRHQHYMNDVFFDYLNDFVFVYINDILIYNNFKKEHVDHVKKILQRLRDADLQIDIDKFEFFVHEVKYLDLIVDRNEIKMNSKKVETILQWITSQNLKQVQNFLKFCNFYRRFIRNFAKIIKWLIKFIRKNVSFIWKEVCKQTFELLKRTIIKTLILAHFDSKKQIYIKSD
jgi:hypothetical protein